MVGVWAVREKICHCWGVVSSTRLGLWALWRFFFASSGVMVHPLSHSIVAWSHPALPWPRFAASWWHKENFKGHCKKIQGYSNKKPSFRPPRDGRRLAGLRRPRVYIDDVAHVCWQCTRKRRGSQVSREWCSVCMRVPRPQSSTLRPQSSTWGAHTTCMVYSHWPLVSL